MVCMRHEQSFKEYFKVDQRSIVAGLCPDIALVQSTSTADHSVLSSTCGAIQRLLSRPRTSRRASHRRLLDTLTSQRSATLRHGPRDPGRLVFRACRSRVRDGIAEAFDDGTRHWSTSATVRLSGLPAFPGGTHSVSHPTTMEVVVGWGERDSRRSERRSRNNESTNTINGLNR